MVRGSRRPSGAARDAPLFTAAFVTLTLSELAYFTAFGVLIPVVPLFVVGPLGAGPAGVGLAVGAFSVTALVLRPFAGRLSDRLGRRPLLLSGGLLFTAVTAAHVLATQLEVLLALRLLLGVAEAMYFVAAVAALADLAPPERLGEALSYNSLSLYLGIAAGPALGEFLLRAGGYRLAWAGGAALALTATLLATRVPETASPYAAGEHRPLIHRALLLPGLAFFSGLAGAAGFLAFAALHARNVGMAGAGTVLAVYGLVVIGCRVVFARVSDRGSPLRLGALALALCAAGLAVTSAVRTAPGLVAGAAVLGVGAAFLTPAFFRAVVSRVGPNQRGGAAGTFSMFVDLGLGGGPVLLGAVAAAAGIPAGFAAAALLAAVGAAGTAAGAMPRRPRQGVA